MADSCPHCGGILDHTLSAKEGKARSYPQLKRHMAICRAAFDNWPEHHASFHPKNPDHLRYWLYVEAGHFEVVKTIRCQSIDPDVAIALLTSVLRITDDDRIFVEIDGNLIVVKKAIGASYAAVRHLEACRTFDEVDAVIEAELKVKVEKLLEEAA